MMTTIVIGFIVSSPLVGSLLVQKNGRTGTEDVMYDATMTLYSLVYILAATASTHDGVAEDVAELEQGKDRDSDEER